MRSGLPWLGVALEYPGGHGVAAGSAPHRSYSRTVKEPKHSKRPR